jgi:uncharacterized protein YcbK (DUF882 family)
MITLKEIIKDADFASLDKEIQDNLNELLIKANKFRAAYGKPMTITSGLRTKQSQIEVYRKKGITDLSKIPFGSAHIKGGAVDVADSDHKLKDFVTNNMKLMEEIGLWFEDFDATGGEHGWLHMQIYAPKSGNRIFKP